MALAPALNRASMIWCAFFPSRPQVEVTPAFMEKL
jgi:hypothetical protein